MVRNTSPRAALIVHGDNVVARNIAIILQDIGFDVSCANGAEDALHYLDRRAQLRPLDLLVCDLFMPGIRGPKLVELVRELFPGIRLLYIAARSGPRTLDAGADPVLQRPFGSGELAQRIAAMFDITRHQVT